MARRSSGFEWPVYVAMAIFLGGTLAFWVISDFKSNGSGGVLGYVIALAIVAPIVVWRWRRIRRSSR